jgi:uncharacterized membrane protein YdbT with pleckstrin-like domain
MNRVIWSFAIIIVLLSLFVWPGFIRYKCNSFTDLSTGHTIHTRYDRFTGHTKRIDAGHQTLPWWASR